MAFLYSPSLKPFQFTVSFLFWDLLFLEGILEHFVHMVLCKSAVVLIKAETMKPSFSDAVQQGKMLKQ